MLKRAFLVFIILCISSAHLYAQEDYTNWLFYKKAYVNTKSGTGAGVSGAVGHFPFLVRLTTLNFDFSKALSTGADIRFSDTTGTIHYPYEIERWDNAVDSAEIWVWTDTIRASDSAFTFRVYYGNTLAADSSRGSAVFDTGNGFVGTWHLKENAAGMGSVGLYKDATINGFNGADSVASTGKSGAIGYGQQFNGTTDYICQISAGAAGTYDLTTSAWIKTTATSAGMVLTNRRVAADRSMSLHVGWWAGTGTGNGRAYTSNDGPTCEYGAIGTTNMAATGNWYLLTGTRTSSSTYTIYVNGASEGTNNSTAGSGCQSSSASATTQWEIGKGDAWTTGWNGYIDEVRLERVSRSANWIKLCYETQKATSTVLTLSAEIANPVVYRIWDGGGIGGKWSTAQNWLGDQVPDSADRVKFDNTSMQNCTLDVAGKANSILFETTYTGTFSFSNCTLSVWGNADFSSAYGITPGTGTLLMMNSQNVKPKSGATMPTILRTGSGITTFLSYGLITGKLIVNGGTVALGSGLSHTVNALSGSGSIDFGSSTLRTDAQTVNLTTFGTITPGTGTLEFFRNTLQTFSPKSGTTHPSILHSGTDTLRLAANNLIATSFTQTAGTLDLSGRNMQTTGNFSISSGNTSFSGLAGRKITVGGNALFSGTSGSKINLNPAAYCTLAVNGSLSAVYTIIGFNRATVSAGSAASCDSLGPTQNWIFDAEDYGSWSNHRPIFINMTSSGSAISTVQTNFPAVLRLSSAEFAFNQCLVDSGKDIRFSTTDGSHLSYEREWWDSLGGNAVVWIRIPSVTVGTKTQKIIMHWGKAGATDKSSGASVFQTSNNFSGVWHLTEDLAGKLGTAIYKDATGSGFTGTDRVGATGKTGAIGRGQEFTAASADYIDFADFTSSNWNAITIEGWANLKTLQTTERSIVRKETQFQLGINNPSTGNIRNLVTTNTTTGWTAANDQIVSIATGTWYYFAFTYNNATSALKHYKNGVQAGANRLVAGTITDNANRTSIGANTGGASLNLDAYIDEVRISNVARSADWLLLCYDNQKPGSQVVHSSMPVVSGRGDTVQVGAYQRDADTGAVWYELEDPNTTPVNISAQYKTAVAGSWTTISTATGNTGNVDTSETTDRQLRWRLKTEPGTNIEGNYLVRIIASDGVNKDTTQSNIFAVDTKPPSGLANFRPTDSTVTSVRLSWTAVTEANFDHYELYYGTVRSAVQNRTASKWDNIKDIALATTSTSTTLITGLTTNTQYYFKIWAIDRTGNEATIADTTASTFSQVSPAWSKNNLGTIYGGAIRDSVLYVAGGIGKISSVNLADGGVKWDYTPSGGGTPNRPSYVYTSGTYKILFSAGTWVYGVRDNGTTSTTLFAQNLGATAGVPYGSPDDTSFVVSCTNTLTKRKISDGSVVSGWPKTITNISTSADPVVYGDMVYVAGTDGKVYKYGMDGTLQATCNVGASVNLPLIETSGRLYVTPNSAKLFCFSTSPFDTIWELNTTTANTGPAFKLSAKDTLWLATGTSVRQVRDNGATGSVLWSYTAGGNVTSGPMCKGDKILYFGIDGGKYYALDRTTQTVKTNWPYRSASGNANVGPWVSESRNLVIFGTDGANLDAFTLE